ncbi:FAD:protein FMN transferase [bacterium]|nr:MAG: FAD:protein FMN transferase [bacterium]
MILSINNSANAAPLARSRYLMGTLLEATLDRAADAPALEAAFAEVARLEGLLSTYRPDSEVSRLNAAAGSPAREVSGDLWALLEASSRAWSASGGLFDPTFSSSPPARGFGRLGLDSGRRKAFLPPGARLDFGGIGKGYALDAAAAVLRAHGVRRALLNFGGQVYALGRWDVETPAGALTLEDASAATSGDAERPGHIVDPATGLSRRGPATATIVSPSATDADAWSTALYLGGPAALPRPFSGCALYVPRRGAPPDVFGDCPRRTP